MSGYIVYDCETQLKSDQVEGGWNNVYGMGMSSCVTYDSEHDIYLMWPHDSRDKLCEYLNNRLVVTFNGIMFDSQLLLGNDRVLEDNGVTANGQYSWQNADIYVEMWRRILKMDKSDYPEIVKKIREQRFPRGIFNLDSVASATLQTKKLGDGADAPGLYQSNRIVELFQYNLQDTRVTTKLYDFIKEFKYIVTGGFDIVSFK